ncbi:MAG: T9SS type A sorting domain-containing protein [Saprospiraceae bacterium]|nr:T9SS type A sorting domain-containing protein [Saprospiraceae bacterium]
MKKLLLLFQCLVLAVVVSRAQTTILDFEAAATSTVFQYFGSTLDGTFNEVIANPNPTGSNTSSMVGRYVKPAVAEVWAGCFSNPDPTVAVDLAANGRIAVKVHRDRIGNLTLKLENSTNGGANWVTTVQNTKINEWEELVFDASQPSIEPPFASASGFVYTRVVLFFDFGASGTGSDVVSYFDDIVALPNATVTTTILDFETPATGTTFQYFGSTLDGTLTETIANPNPTGLNTSANVLKYVKPAVAEVWAGAFSNPDPTTPVDVSGGAKVCIKVHLDHIGNLALKLEGSTSGKPNWITQVPNTKVNEWEELCFDASVPSIEPPFEAASGIYTRVVLFFDFGTPGTGTDVVSYLDDVVVKSGGAPQVRTVNFKVDMNSYTANFDQVYISGNFNNWSGDANPLSDPDLDGIWEGSISVPNGLYEYKVTLDNWAVQEQFGGFEECTKTDPSGQFVNRFLPVSADTDVPRFCFNSCYACGEEVKITFKLGMNGIAPNPDGVWLAGGGNFDVPGGKYKMSDTDGDGIFEIVVPRKQGFSSYYTFANGPCPDYSCKENLEGLPCGNPANFNDRFLPATNSNVTVATCFGACFTNAECISSVKNLVQDAQIFTLLGNPSNAGTTVLQFGNSIFEDKSIMLTNTIGQVLGQWHLSGGVPQFELHTSDFQPGIYFVTVRAGERFFTRKLAR